MTLKFSWVGFVTKKEIRILIVILLLKLNRITLFEDF